MNQRNKFPAVLILIIFLAGNFGCQIVFNKKDEIAKPEVDFSALNEVESILVKYSVFREKLQDPAENAEIIFKLFFAGNNVSAEKIPDWARVEKTAAVDFALQKHRPVDYSFLNDIFSRGVAGLGFAKPKNEEEKFRILESIVRGFIEYVGDPFAYYADPVEVKLGAAGDSSKYDGVGFTLSLTEGAFIIVDVLEDSPAQEAGLQKGDIVAEIDGKDASIFPTIKELVLYIRQKADPQISLRVKRNGQTINVILERKLIKKVQLATWPSFDLPDGGAKRSTAKDLPYDFPLKDRDGNPREHVVYLKLSEFSVQMVNDLYYVLQEIPWKKYRSVIIDLRGNPGGYVHATIAALSYFFKGGEVVITTEYYNGKKDFEIIPKAKVRLGSGDWAVTAHPGLVPANISAVVLIDSKSFSSSEVFASAMQHSRGVTIIGKENGGGLGSMVIEDAQRATLVGKERSGGKGTVNRWFPLGNGEYGALYITIGLWKTAYGESVEPLRDGHGGLLPQVLVPEYDSDIFTALDIIAGQQ